MYGATAGNNRKVHAVREIFPDFFMTYCGLRTPKRPQTTQNRLPKCKRCF